MKSFKDYITEALDRLEIHSTSVSQARAYAEKLFTDLNKELPNFDQHYKEAKRQAVKGSTLRKDMPVISSDVYNDFEKYIKEEYGVGIKRTKLSVGKLEPTQRQIYFDKSIDGIARNGIVGSKKFINSKIFVVSSDLKIIDGHHRYLSALLIDKNMKVPVMIVDMPMKKLLPITLKFSDSAGKIRNEE